MTDDESYKAFVEKIKAELFRLVRRDYLGSSATEEDIKRFLLKYDGPEWNESNKWLFELAKTAMNNVRLDMN